MNQVKYESTCQSQWENFDIGLDDIQITILAYTDEQLTTQLALLEDKQIITTIVNEKYDVGKRTHLWNDIY